LSIFNYINKKYDLIYESEINLNFKKIEILNFLGFKQMGVFYFHEKYPNITFDFDNIGKSATIAEVIIKNCLDTGRQEVINSLKGILKIKE
jgi:hypothetical protein